MAHKPLRNVNWSNAPKALGPTPNPAARLTSSGAAPQAKMAGPDKWGISVYRCSRHENVDYRVKDPRKPVCPVCDSDARVNQLRDELKKVTGANDLLQRDLQRLRTQLSHLEGMREAVSELSQEDAMFLKDLIYRHKADPDSVRVTQKIAKRTVRKEGYGTAVRHEVVGFDVEYRGGDEVQHVSHLATSIGGKMIALQFSEALKVTGLKGAMETLRKAMSDTLANARE